MDINRLSGTSLRNMLMYAQDPNELSKGNSVQRKLDSCFTVLPNISGMHYPTLDKQIHELKIPTSHIYHVCVIVDSMNVLTYVNYRYPHCLYQYGDQIKQVSTVCFDHSIFHWKWLKRLLITWSTYSVLQEASKYTPKCPYETAHCLRSIQADTCLITYNYIIFVLTSLPIRDCQTEYL